MSDTETKIVLLREKIANHKMDFDMKSFYTKGDGEVASRKHPRTGDGPGPGPGAVARGTYAAYCAELRTHDYEVEPEVIVNASGIPSESLCEV